MVRAQKTQHRGQKRKLYRAPERDVQEQPDGTFFCRHCHRRRIPAEKAERHGRLSQFGRRVCRS